MAFSLQNIRDAIQTSLHGRRVGLHRNDYLIGFPDMVRPVSNATSATTETALAPSGIHTVVTTTNDTWTLTDPPVAGLEVKLITNSSSTGVHTVTCAAANILSTLGTSHISVDMNSEGAAITLVSLTTALWGVMSIHPSSAQVTLTT